MSREFILRLCMLAAIYCAASATVARADQWARYTMPLAPGDVDGFTCVVELINPSAEGYLPLRLTALSAVGSFPGDRQIRLVVTPERGGNVPASRTTYSLPMLLPEGKAATTVDFYLPKYFIGANLSLRLMDADGPMRGYRVDLRAPATGISGLAPSDLFTRLAIILPDAADMGDQPWQRVPDLRSLDAVIYPDPTYMNSDDPGRLANDQALDHIRLKSFQAGQVMRMSETHPHWLGYESVDVILVPFPILERMRLDAPERFTAIVDWVTCGGVLWTYGIGDAAAVETMFEVRGAPDAKEKLADELTRARLRMDRAAAIPNNPTTLSYVQPTSPTNEELTLLGTNATSFLQYLDQKGHVYGRAESADDLRNGLVRVPLAAGVIVGMVSEDPFPGSFEYWHAVRHLSGRNQLWRYRRSTSLVRGSTGYWDWLLADVARPPVFAFLMVLTVFVLLVGPVSYYWTRRIGRSFLMFIIAPLLASIATLALFGYGLIADGLGTQARVRQITWSDGPSGRSARATRATYFTAFRRPQGLRFSDDAAVYPISEPEEAWRQLYERNDGATRQIVLADDAQILLGDFLPARTQSQFIDFRPLAGERGITLTTDDSGVPRVTNGLAESLRYLIARADDGQYWVLDAECQPNDSAELTRLSDDERAPALREIYRRAPLEPPPGFVMQSRDRRSSYWYNDIAEQLRTDHKSWARSSDALGVFEANLREILSDAAELPLGSFVGIADISDDAIVVEDAVPVDSIHMVMGTLE